MHTDQIKQWRDEALSRHTRLAIAGPRSRSDYTIAWICALEIELTAARAVLDEEHDQLPNAQGDDNYYLYGRIHKHNVVVACLPPPYGTNKAASVAATLKRSFKNIRATLVVGIGGGVPEPAGVRLGDVVVGTTIKQYDLGKIGGHERFEPKGDTGKPPRLLSTAIQAVRMKHRHQPPEFAREITLIAKQLQKDTSTAWTRPSAPDQLFTSSYVHPENGRDCRRCSTAMLVDRSPRPRPNEPRIHYGTVASGNLVVKSGIKRDELARDHDVICVEMEAAGVMVAFDCLPIRGICDYADSHKNKAWQGYAAAVAAIYAKELLGVVPIAEEPRRTKPPEQRLVPIRPRAVELFDRQWKQQTEATWRLLARRRGLFKSLAFEGMGQRLTEVSLAHKATCRWLLEHPAYKGWLDHSSDVKEALHIVGKAGAGKSTLMRHLYAETKAIESNLPTCVASFFFKARGRALEKSAEGMYRTLLWSLLDAFEDLRSILDDTDIVSSQHQGCPGLNSLKMLFLKAIRELGKRPFICFIDGLDECDQAEMGGTVSHLGDAMEEAAAAGTRFRVCVSGRPYPPIVLDREKRIRLEDEQGHNEDLAAYVENRLKVLRHSFTPELRAEVLRKASGIFLWIVLVVDLLISEFNDGGSTFMERLRDIPSDLGELFKSILTRDDKAINRLQCCTMLVFAAWRPLNSREFCHALCMVPHPDGQPLPHDFIPPTYDDEETRRKWVASSSKGLCEISKLDEVQYIHESVREFFIHNGGAEILWPGSGSEWIGRGHDALKELCLAYLRQTMVVEGPPRSWGRLKHTSMYQYPFLQYSWQYVLDHANAAAPLLSQEAFLGQFPVQDWIGIARLFGDDYTYDINILYILAERGHTALVQDKLRDGLGIDFFGQEMGHPLVAAIVGGHMATARLLLEHPTSLFRLIELGKFPKQYGGVSLLQRAINVGPSARNEDRLEVVRSLAKHGADIKLRTRVGDTPLTVAAATGQMDVVKVLIEAGADIESADADGNTPLKLASRHGHMDVAEFLIEHNADVNSHNDWGFSPLFDVGPALGDLLIRSGAATVSTLWWFT